jgi:hypothetical protein
MQLLTVYDFFVNLQQPLYNVPLKITAVYSSTLTLHAGTLTVETSPWRFRISENSPSGWAGVLYGHGV